MYFGGHFDFLKVYLIQSNNLTLEKDSQMRKTLWLATKIRIVCELARELCILYIWWPSWRPF